MRLARGSPWRPAASAASTSAEVERGAQWVDTLAEREGSHAGRGNGNSGHEYGTTLSVQEKSELLEYLKTL